MTQLSTIDETTADGVMAIAPGTVRITQKMINEIIPPRIRENIGCIDDYMYKLLIFSQIKLLMYQNEEQISGCIINYDFHCKTTNEPLYCLIIKSSNVNSKHEFIMEDILFTGIEIVESFAIKPNSLPKPLSMDKYFIGQINKFNDIKMKIQTIINSTEWDNIAINSKKNEKSRLILSTSEFRNKLRADINMANMDHLVPIVRTNHKYEWWIEHLWIVKIEDSITVGISLRLNTKTQRIDVTGIHLNKEFIIESHTLIPPHDCHCLDKFISFYDLEIGDIDKDKMKQYHYELNYYKFKKFIQDAANTSVDDSVKSAATQLLNNVKSPGSNRPTVVIPEHIYTCTSKIPIPSHMPISTPVLVPQQQNYTSISLLPIACMSMTTLPLPPIACMPMATLPLPYTPIQIPGGNGIPLLIPSPTVTDSPMNIAHVPFMLKNKKPVYIGKDVTNKYLKEIKQLLLFTNTKQLFYYLNHSIMMQINDGFAQIYSINPDLVIVNCDLCHTFGYDLYVIIQRYNMDIHKDKYEWQVVKLCDIKTISNEYNISNDQLPLSSRKLRKFMWKFNLHRNIKITHSDIYRINFKAIKAFKTKSYKRSNKKKKIINCSVSEIRTWIITAIMDNNVIPIPIVRNKEQKHWIESVIICAIPREDVNFGVSFVCNENNNNIEATCIFLDKVDIVNQNRLTGQVIICNVLDKFVPGIGKMNIK